MDLAALDLYYQDLGPIFSQYSPRAWLLRYMYWKQSLAKMKEKIKGEQSTIMLNEKKEDETLAQPLPGS